jgi:hypothetical protein
LTTGCRRPRNQASNSNGWAAKFRNAEATHEAIRAVRNWAKAEMGDEANNIDFSRATQDNEARSAS